MIGHRTPRYEAFGWAAARFDDVINLPASRLSAIFLTLAAFAIGASPTGAMQRGPARCAPPPLAERRMAGSRDGGRAWPETRRPARLRRDAVDDAFMGNGRREATAADINRALRLYQAACAAQSLLLLALISSGKAEQRGRGRYAAPDDRPARRAHARPSDP